VPLDDAPDDGQAETVAACTFGGEERFEHAAPRVFRHPAAGVVHAAGDLVAFAADADPAGPPRPAPPLEGIDEQIREDLPELFGPALDGRRRTLHPDVVVDAAALRFVLPLRPCQLMTSRTTLRMSTQPKGRVLTRPRELLNPPDRVGASGSSPTSSPSSGWSNGCRSSRTWDRCSSEVVRRSFMSPGSNLLGSWLPPCGRQG
jgi:hypothetical protein